MLRYSCSVLFHYSIAGGYCNILLQIPWNVSVNLIVQQHYACSNVLGIEVHILSSKWIEANVT